MTDEQREKLRRVREWLAAHRLDGVLLSTRASFAWLTGGGDDHVVAASESGAARILVTPRRAVLLADVIEMPRLLAEEPVGGLASQSFAWEQDEERVVTRLVRGKRVQADDGAFGLRRLPPEFYAMRWSLLPGEVERYESLGRAAAAAVEAVARALRPAATEHEVAGQLAAELRTRGVAPHVVLVGSDERIARFRHPVPTAKRIERAVMLVVCGQRYGLIASLTRLVHFGAPPPDLVRRHVAVLRVEAALWNATRLGASYGDAFRAGMAAYAAAGFRDEWKHHHQGGPTGYASRDFKATPGERRTVQPFQAVAWNPSIAGTKSEDTILVRPDGFDVLTEASIAWPRSAVSIGEQMIGRPDILVR
jgi:Xaa-Pro aminopeptidase